MSAEKIRGDVPVLNDKADYITWKKEVTIWKQGTNAKPAQMASKLIMNMRGKPRATALDIDPTKLGVNDGLKNLLEALDSLYNKDGTQVLFAAIDDFESYRRPQVMGIDEYVLEFQTRYRSLKQLSAASSGDDLYADAILAYRLLNQASLSDSQRQLIKATCNNGLSFAKMEEQLRRTFGDGINMTGTAQSSRDDNKIKIEPTFMARSHDQCGEFEDRRRSQFENGSRSHFEDRSRSQFEENEDTVYFNGATYRKGWDRQPENTPNVYQRDRFRGKPYDRNRGSGSNRGRSSYDCFLCGEKGHMVRECPQNRVQGNSKQDRYSFFQTDFAVPNSGEQEAFLEETSNRALLDTGASETVCGESWLQKYEESLPEVDRSWIKMESCEKNFRFGVKGEAVQSCTKKTIPVTICGTKKLIDVHLVDNQIPLLLSRMDMKNIGIVIDLPKDQIWVGGKNQDLILTGSGHQVIELGGLNQARNRRNWKSH